MGLQLTAKIDGVEQLKIELAKVEQTIEDFSPVWAAVKKKFHEIESDNFQSGNAKGASGRWADLSPAYEEIKVKKYGTFALLAGTLRATDALYKSLSGDTSDSVFETDKTSMSVGTSLPYAKAHQYGVPSRNLPARPPIDLSGEQKDELSKVMKKEIRERVKRTTTLKVTGTDEI